MGFGSSWSGTGSLIASSLIVKGTPGSTGDLEITNDGVATIIKFWNVLHTKYADIYSFDPDPVGGSVLPTISLEAGIVQLFAEDGSRTPQSNLVIQGGTQPFFFHDYISGDSLLFDTSLSFTGAITVAGSFWTDVTLINGWANRAGWDHLSYRMGPDGRVWLRGSIAGGTSASGTNIGNIAAGWRPVSSDTIGPISSQAMPAAYPGATFSPSAQVTKAGDIFIYGTGAGPLFFGGYSYPII